jgi:CspA family cold shock protein
VVRGASDNRTKTGKTTMNDNANGKLKGVVTYWNPDRGFGFACKEENGGEVFVHINNLVDEDLDALEVGQHIAFEERPSKRGDKPEAIDVELLTPTKDGELLEEKA